MLLHPKPTEEELREVYGVNYFQNQDFFQNDNKHIYGYFDYISERLNKQAQYDSLLDAVIKHLSKFESGKSRYLDIGCGLGYMLDLAFDRGFEVAGVEFNENAVKKLKEKYRFRVFNGDILDYDDNPFNVISMLDVIEHLTDPVAAARKVHQLLHPGGIFVLTTMDCDSIVSKILGKRLEDFRRIREHLYFFSRKTIRLMLEKLGFEIIDIQYYGHTFRLDFLVNRIKLVSPRLGRIICKIIKPMHISHSQFYINPCTKMIVFSKRISSVDNSNTLETKTSNH